MAEQKATNVTWHEHHVSKAEREKLNGHPGSVLWFTGLSACGKSTVANTVDHLLHSQGKRSFVLDGDNIRMGLNKNLGFSPEDRTENIRRIGEVAKLFSSAGIITSVCTVLVTSPPTIGAAIRCITSLPVPVPIITGARPMIVVSTVISFGRTRSTAPSSSAAFKRSTLVRRPALRCRLTASSR